MIIKKENFNLKKISYIKVGGIVKTYLEIDDLLSLKNLEEDYIILGNTSKSLFMFSYSPLTYLKFTKDNVIFYQDSFFAYSGIILNKLYTILKNHNISMFMYLSSIPGTLGGGLILNASCFNETISTDLIYVLVYKNHQFKKIYFNDIVFDYRYSSLINEGLIVGARYKINNRKYDKSLKEIYLYRLKNQELKNNLGSTFNLKNVNVGKLISQLNLKGLSISKQIKISEKHANFILINSSNYLEVYYLINLVKSVIYKSKGEIVNIEIQMFCEYGKRKN